MILHKPLFWEYTNRSFELNNLSKSWLNALFCPKDINSCFSLSLSLSLKHTHTQRYTHSLALKSVRNYFKVTHRTEKKKRMPYHSGLIKSDKRRQFQLNHQTKVSLNCLLKDLLVNCQHLTNKKPQLR